MRGPAAFDPYRWRAGRRVRICAEGTVPEFLRPSRVPDGVAKV